MANYINGAVTVQPGTPTLICTVPSENDGVLIQNAGTASVFLGGPNVMSSGPNQGLNIPPGQIINVPSVGGRTNKIYGTSESLAQAVVYLMPDTN